MSPEESLRLKCVQLALDTGDWNKPGTGLVATATAIEGYVTGKHAAMMERLMQPVELSAWQEEAVRIIVADHLATMFDGADRRIREEMATSADRSTRVLKDILGRITGAEVFRDLVDTSVAEASIRNGMNVSVGGPE